MPASLCRRPAQHTPQHRNPACLPALVARADVLSATPDTRQIWPARSSLPLSDPNRHPKQQQMEDYLSYVHQTFLTILLLDSAGDHCAKQCPASDKTFSTAAEYMQWRKTCLREYAHTPMLQTRSIRHTGHSAKPRTHTSRGPQLHAACQTVVGSDTPNQPNPHACLPVLPASGTALQASSVRPQAMQYLVSVPVTTEPPTRARLHSVPPPAPGTSVFSITP
ncbi:hypothetical protein BDK51DRAFT_46914 [Blyttiomyces helicus]|uniref:Uncharacterized protein n=1 Tax=Blyttiomyces helicus TaxID=388810 RepID=A0A4P9WMM8_9FUNG|nr:hypothetical protein BDK51DRAFT_46914 [Blyttiomyces helicus]|eukprot:RKO94329.1 hypothetical protein BDK51DRAFT_46914 [Blyttiomyces helicus]